MNLEMKAQTQSNPSIFVQRDIFKNILNKKYRYVVFVNYLFLNAIFL